MSSFDKSHWKRFNFYSLLHMNVLLCILLKKISVLTAYKFIMTSLLKVYSVMNMKHMLHQSITNGNIMKENMVKNFRKIITTGLQSRYGSDMDINRMKYSFEHINLNRSVLYFIHYWTRLNLMLTVKLLVWTVEILICSVYPMQNVYVLKQCHQNKVK